MTVWKFQLLPGRKDALGVGFRMDPVGQAFEKQVNEALRYPFGFHGINKLVLELGPTIRPKKDYIELLGVAVKQCPGFDLERYALLPEHDRQDSLKIQTLQVFDWLVTTFPDAQFASTALENLRWRSNVLQ